MSPTYSDDNEPHNLPGVGRLGETAAEFEKRRLLEEQDKEGIRSNFGGNEGESWDTPEATHDAIAQMAAGRAGAAARAYREGRLPPGPPRYMNPPPPPEDPNVEYSYDPDLNLVVPSRVPTVRETPQINQPPGRTVTLGREEVQSLVAFEMKEAFGGIRRQIADIALGIEEQNRLMRHIDAPMEAITGAHERASASFETLRRDILGGGMDKLEKVLDVSGLTEQATKTEQRLEAMMNRLEKKIDEAFTAHAGDMIKILNLLARLQARELRETQRRAAAGHATHKLVEDPSQPSPFSLLKAAVMADTEYAWSLHCNIAMPMVDELRCTSQQANRAAAAVMQHWFGVDVTEDPAWKHLETLWAR